MRRQSVRMLSMILVILFTFTSIQLIPTFAAEGRTAKIYDFTNSVSVTRGKSSIKVYKGMRLKEGDTIKTGKKSIAYIEIDNDKLVKMDASTIITISNLNGTDKNGNINISLSAGKIYNDIKKKLTKNSTYKVRTPNAVMGVRGTTFVVDLEPSGNNSNITNLTVLDGTVAFATSKQEDTNVYVEKNHKASTFELSEDNLPIIKKVSTQDLGTFELEEVAKDTELKENISEILKQENTTLDDVIKQAEKREIELEKQANEDRLKESSNSKNNNNKSSDKNISNNGNGNPNVNPNNNGSGNGNSGNASGNNGNGNPNANPNNNGNGNGIGNGNGNGNSGNTSGNNGNGNPNANPNNNGNGNGIGNGKGNGNSGNASGNNGNGNPNANPNNNGNGNGNGKGNGNGNGNSGNTSGNNGNGNPNANPNNNGNGNGIGNGKGNGNSGNASGNSGNGNPNANPNNNGNGNGIGNGNGNGNSGNVSGNSGNGNPNANPNNNGNGNGNSSNASDTNENTSNTTGSNVNNNDIWYPPFWGPIYIPGYNWGW